MTEPEDRTLRSSIQLIYNIVVAAQNTRAPEIFERAHSSLFNLGVLLAEVPGFDEPKLKRASIDILPAIVDSAREELTPHSPEFMVILITMLRSSIEGYLANLPDAPMPPSGGESTH